MPNGNLYHVAEKNGERQVTSILEHENGKIDFSITTSNQTLKSVSTFSIGVDDDNRVHGTDTVKLNRIGLTREGNVTGLAGTAVNPKLAAKIRETYKGYKQGQPMEVTKVSDVITEWLKQVPMKQIKG